MAFQLPINNKGVAFFPSMYELLVLMMDTNPLCASDKKGTSELFRTEDVSFYNQFLGEYFFTNFQFA
jgi:hypothetical protein